MLKKRPFRVPLHMIADVGLMGGCSAITPGEISLVHHGVLSLDALPAFPHCTPESGAVTISRAFVRILRVARTIADLGGREQIGDNDLFEAIQFRQFEASLR